MGRILGYLGMNPESDGNPTAFFTHYIETKISQTYSEVQYL